MLARSHVGPVFHLFPTVTIGIPFGNSFRQNKVGILVSPTRLETLPRDHQGVVSLLGLGLSLRLGGFFSEEHVCGFDHQSAFLG